MDSTPVYGFPYPECDPPLVKDASDITQMRDLAVAIDGAVQDLVDKVNDELLIPDACRMNMSAAVATTDQEVTPFNDVLNWQTAGSGMADVAAGGIRIQEQGWYFCGGYTEVSATIPAATQLSLRTCVMKNAAQTSNYQDSGRIISGDFQYSFTGETLLLNAGDLIQIRHRSGAGAGISWTYRSRIWAIQLLAT